MCHIVYTFFIHILYTFCTIRFCLFCSLQSASVAQLDVPSCWGPGGCGFNPRRGRQHSFVEIGREMFSTVILSLPLVREGRLLVSGEGMCTVLVGRLGDWACPVDVWLDWPRSTWPHWIDWAVKPQHKQTVHYNSVHISVNTNILFHKNQMQDILSRFFFFFPSSDTFYNVECIYM